MQLVNDISDIEMLNLTLQINKNKMYLQTIRIHLSTSQM